MEVPWRADKAKKKRGVVRTSRKQKRQRRYQCCLNARNGAVVAHHDHEMPGQAPPRTPSPFDSPRRTSCATLSQVTVLLKSLLANLDREAWLRFLLALAGLALAFAAATFSSTASDAGNVAATAVFSSVALFLSGLFGALSGPQLCR